MNIEQVIKLIETEYGDKSFDIEERVYTLEGDDILFGICRWENGKLVSIDGDNYYTDTEVEKFSYDKNQKLLTVIEHTKWQIGNGSIINTKDLKHE